MNDLIDLLKSNHQVILTGAPGTGKTYLAKQIAANMLGCQDKDLTKDQRFGFVQFHPAYDYTDFVEGLKPVIDGNVDKGQIAFEVRDGRFMKFCKEAAKLCNVAEENKVEPPKCVFVIDEINRADLSRVFGELFYALEPDYRGKQGAVSTQYALGRNESDRQDFYVPKNVYIIGTMNDIDRSVESIDFALRRRFAWYEVKADVERFNTIMQDIMNDSFQPKKDEARDRYNSLNKVIADMKEEGLGPSYQIGPAYFRKLKEYIKDSTWSDDNWDKFWSHHLQSLIHEYVRGMPKADDKIKKLHAAYKLEREAKREN